MPTELSAERAVDTARILLDEALRSGSRRMLGIAGAPGAGKSTLAARLADQLRRSFLFTRKSFKTAGDLCPNRHEI